MRLGRVWFAAALSIATLQVAVARVAGAQLLSTDNFALYGYLTQAYAASDNYQVIGIPKGGTADYSRAALLLRFTPDSHDAFVLQLAHRRLGDSPANAFYSDVLLDWAFYQHSFGDASTIQVGQMPIPFGIFNETRYVGTLLPFFRPAYGFYEEGAYTSETVDGAKFIQRLFPTSPWQITVSLYAGTYNYLQFGTVYGPAQLPTPVPPDTAAAYIGARITAKNVLGGQVWFSTPVDGLRLGVGGIRHDDYGGVFTPDSIRQPTAHWTGSLDYRPGRLSVAAEYDQEFYTEEGSTVRSRANSWYAQAGYRIVGPFTLNLIHNEQTSLTTVEGYKFRSDDVNDTGIGGDYQVNEHVVLKLEGHRFIGDDIEAPVAYDAPAVKDNYGIASVSVSF